MLHYSSPATTGMSSVHNNNNNNNSNDHQFISSGSGGGGAIMANLGIERRMNEIINETTTGGSSSITTTNNTLIDNNNLTTTTTKWEYEEITLERGPAGLGFTVAGGIDDPHYANDYSIYITRFIPNGPAALNGRLKLEDIIVRVDDNDLIDVKHSEAVAALKNSGNRVQLFIKRRSPIIVNHHHHSSFNNNNNNIDNYDDSSISLSTRQQQEKLKNNNQQLKNIFIQSNNNNQKQQHQQPQTRNSPSRFFTSTLNNNQSLPPLPRSSQSGSAIQRGSTQYATTREGARNSSAGTNLSRLRSGTGSSSQSLQNPDEIDSTIGLGLYSKDQNSKSTPAIDTEEAKNLTRLPRTVTLQRTPKGLGINIVGGVAGGGTFISYIVPGGVAERSGKLHCGDQILSVNGIDLRHATHEEAASSLKRAGQVVKLVVKYRPEEYIKFENKINDLREKNMLSTGTLQTSQKRSLYARALFDYDPSKDSGLPSKGLSFRFGDILHIINASDDEWWQARRVLENGQDDIVHGIIPSKRRVEKRERARLKSVKFINRNCSESMLDRRKKKFSFSKKFPFMKSRENISLDFDDYDLSAAGSQSNSRAVLSSSSTTSINNGERDSIKYDNDEGILSYEPVLQHDIDYARPLALYGPIKDEIEALRDDLSCDDRFYRMESIVPFTTRPPKEGEVEGVKYHFVSMQEMKRDLARHKFVEAGELNNNLYGTSIDSIKEIADSGKHVLLNISPKALKRLIDANIHPITIFIKPKSIESLLEMNKRWTHEEAITAMAQANRMEQDYGNYFTTTIPLESPNDVLREIMNIIAQQSGPRIWIPTTFEALDLAN